MSKKSFNLYKNWRPMIKALDAESKAQLFDAIFDWQCTGEYVLTNPVLEGYMALFVSKFQEDDASYSETCEKNKENGKKGGRPRKAEETQENPVGFTETQSNPEKPDNDNDNDNDTDNEIDTVSISPTKGGARVSEKQLREEFEEIWKLYPRKIGKPKSFDYYKRDRRAGASPGDILNGVSRYVAYLKATGTEDKYIRMGSTFFNQKNWLDPWEVPRSRTQRAIEEVDAWAAQQSTTLPW